MLSYCFLELFKRLSVFNIWQPHNPLFVSGQEEAVQSTRHRSAVSSGFVYIQQIHLTFVHSSIQAISQEICKMYCHVGEGSWKVSDSNLKGLTNASCHADGLPRPHLNGDWEASKGGKASPC